MFDAKKLFERLHAEADDIDILICGGSLSLKPVSVKGSQSTCFLSLDQNDLIRMKLVILCRTQGIDLGSFMFREKCNVGIHILDNIASEASGIVLKALKYAAECLLRDKIWMQFSSMKQKPFSKRSPTSKRNALQRQELADLLKIVSVCPFLKLYKRAGFTKHDIPVEVSFLFSDFSGIDWFACCATMKKIKFFSPNISFEINEEGCTETLFYVQRYDVFLLLAIKKDATLFGADLIEKKTNQGSYQGFIDSFVSFLLQFAWQNF